MKKPAFAIILSYLFLFSISAQCLADVYGSGWYREIQFSIEHEDNVSRSYKDEDLVSDMYPQLVSVQGTWVNLEHPVDDLFYQKDELTKTAASEIDV